MTTSAARAGYHWVDASHGRVPEGAAPHGHTNDGSPLWLARAWFAGGLHLGKVRPALAGATIAWGGSEHIVQDYQVLLKAGSWVAASDGELPDQALPFGYEAGGEALSSSQ